MGSGRSRRRWRAQTIEQNDSISIPIVFTPEQQKYVQELNQKAASLSCCIQDLRLRLPPPDISQRLPHLHAHSLASNAAFALQLNSHSATREQELDEIDKNLITELENAQTASDTNQSGKPSESVVESKTTVEAEPDTEPSKSAILDKLENKKKELNSMEETVQDLEKKWAQIQDKALKQPSSAQREKMLDKLLHSLIEQLAAKQAQAEGLVSEIHFKEGELERLNVTWRKLEMINVESSNARIRLGRSTSEKEYASSDYVLDAHHKLPYYVGGRTENQQKLILLRSALVLYILALHILVFIKISL